MTLADLSSGAFTGADLRARVNAALTELRAARRFATVSALLTDASLAYGSGARAVAAGEIVEAGGHRYQVASASAADHDVSTAGGVRLYVLPLADGAMPAEAFGWQADNLQASATANTTAARAAIAGAFARGSGEVIFPGGTGYINGTLSLKRSTLLRGGNWLPSGDPYTIKLADNSDCDMVRTEYAGASYSSSTDTIFGGGIKRLILDGNRAGQSGANDPVTGQLPTCITAKHWVLAVIEDVRAVYAVGHGVWWGQDCNTCTVTRLQTGRNGKSGIYINNSTVNTVFTQLDPENNTEYGVELGVLATDTNGATFLNPTFEYNRKGDFNFLNGARAGITVIGHRTLGLAYTGGAMTSGAATLTIATQTLQFQASDVGALVHVPGAGGAGADLITTIAAYVSPTEVTLAANAGTTVSGARVCQGVSYRYAASVPPPQLVVINGNHGTDRPVAVHDLANSRTKLASRDLLTFYVEIPPLGGALAWTAAPWSGSLTYATGVGPAYSRDLFGIVRMRGQVTVSSGTLIATLPAGYRPAGTMYFPGVTAAGTAVRLQVLSTGEVHCLEAPATAIALNSIQFEAAP